MVLDYPRPFPARRVRGGGGGGAQGFPANPYWSSAHFLLAATHAKLGRLDAAKSAAVRVLELEPGFTISGMCAAFDIHESLAAPLSEALSVAGLPA